MAFVRRVRNGMSQAKLIQYGLVGVPLGMVMIGVLSLAYSVYAPNAESRDGGRDAAMLRADVSEAALRAWVETLANKIGPRPAQDEAKMRETAKWIQSELGVENMGYKRVNVLTFPANGAEYRNVEVEIPGREKPAEIVIVGAHYDSVPGCPAANDNGSGVAALLALAKNFIGTENARTLRFVAFANEEPPNFQNETMGSLVYAKACKTRGDNVVAMISLETMGYYDDKPRSQSFPPGLRRFYPDTGNFIGFVGNLKSKALVERFHASFKRHSTFPAEKASLPPALPGIGWSDHWSFWQAGYLALMVTDTATFRYPHYHLPSDTPDKLDYPRFTAVVKGVALVVKDLVNE